MPQQKYQVVDDPKYQVVDDPAIVGMDTTPRNSLNRFGTGIYKMTVQPFKDIWSHQQQNVQEYGPLLAAPKTGFDILMGLLKSSNEQGVTALKSLGRGDVGQFIQHAPGVVPGIGPAAVEASEEMERGNVAGGLGEAFGLITSAAALPKAGAIGKRAVKAASRSAGAAAERLYQSALKPGPGTYSPAEATEMVRSGLESKIPVSPGGLDKLNALIDNLNREREALVESAPNPEVRIELRNRPRLGPAPREMPPPSTDQSGQVIMGEPAIQTTFKSETQPVPRAALTPGGTPAGSGRFVIDVETGQRQPIPIVTKPEILEGLTAEGLIDMATRDRGFSVKDSRPRTTTEPYSGPYSPPATSTTVKGREAFTAENSKPLEVATRIENAKNAQLVEVIEQRARDSGLLQAAQEAAKESGQPIPLRFSDIYDVKLKNVIYPEDVAKRIDQISDRFRSVNPEADLGSLQAAKEEFLRNYPNPLSLKQAQKLKSTTYRVVGNRAYMENATKTRAATEAEKALARGLMEEIGEQIPAVKAINARESKALGLLPALERAVGRIKNWEVFAPGIYGSLGGLSTGMLSGSPEAGAAVGAIVTILRDPYLKSKLAIGINRAGSRQGMPIGINAATKMIESYIDTMAKTAAGLSISISGQPKRSRLREQVP